jgi:hypothetical protein
VVVVRQSIKERPSETGKQARLFKDYEILNQYRYSAYIPNLSLSGQMYGDFTEAEQMHRTGSGN